MLDYEKTLEHLHSKTEEWFGGMDFTDSSLSIHILERAKYHYKELCSYHGQKMADADAQHHYAETLRDMKVQESLVSYADEKLSEWKAKAKAKTEHQDLYKKAAEKYEEKVLANAEYWDVEKTLSCITQTISTVNKLLERDQFINGNSA